MNVRERTDRLRAWLAANGPEGSDPYDALNSPFAALAAPFGRWGRIAFLQAARRRLVPRAWLRIPPTVNAKGIALIARAEAILADVRDDRSLREAAVARLGTLDALAERRDDTLGWGYPFDWAARAFFVPRGTPSVVVTATVGDALIELGATDERLHAAARFVARRLNRHEEGDAICFSYTPVDRSRVLNASLRGASLLAATGDAEHAALARRATRFVLDRQHADGSWPYGLAAHHRWTDGHHTGFVLRDLAAIAQRLRWDEPLAAARRGWAFYRERLVADDGRPVHRLDSPYPADVHAAAEAILVGSDPHLAAVVDDGDDGDGGGDGAAFSSRTLEWTERHLGRADGAFGTSWRPGRGPRAVDRTPHLRWGQAWMLLALACLERRLG